MISAYVALIPSGYLHFRSGTHLSPGFPGPACPACPAEPSRSSALLRIAAWVKWACTEALIRDAVVISTAHPRLHLQDSDVEPPILWQWHAGSHFKGQTGL